eukprot:5022614-Karenia_brevis.AAC.1
MQYKMILCPDSNPLRHLTFQPGAIKPLDFDKRRSGQPRAKWTENSMRTMWTGITNFPYAQYRNTVLDVNNHDHVRTVYTAARYGHIGYP